MIHDIIFHFLVYPTVETDALPAVYLGKKIANSLTISFNTTFNIQREELHAAQVRIYREALSREEIAALENECDISYIDLVLYTRVHTDGQKDYLSPEKVVSLQKDQLAKSQWIVFSGLKQAYPRWIDNTSTSLRVVIEGSCAGVHPSEIGLLSRARKEPLILGFSKSLSSNEDAAQIAQGLARVASLNRAKRQNIISLDSYSDHSCRLYPLTVSHCIMLSYHFWAIL